MMHKFVEFLAKSMAVLGGIVLSLLIIMVCISVLGRELNDILHGWAGGIFPNLSQRILDWGVGPINGDFELLEAGVAFAIFSFFPLCQLTANHASVDILTQQFSQPVNRALRMVIDIVFAIVLIVIAYQLYNGMQSKMRYGDTTFLLQFPVWWGYAAGLLGACVAAFVGAYVAVVRIAECTTAQSILSQTDSVDS